MSSALPRNEARFTLAEVARVTGGSLTRSPATVTDCVATDTRAPLEGALFVALTGDRFDAHDFVGAAVRAGARAVLVERDVGEPGVPVVRVGSTLAALGALGQEWRRRWGGKLFAVAGSAGKTTTRAALAAVLRTAVAEGAHFAPGNFNNRIGVPLVLLGLPASARAAVVEIGTNSPGEVRMLTELAAPDVGVLTLIGYEHTEGLGDLDGIEREEGDLFRALPRGAVAVGNIDDERVARQLAGASVEQRVGYGQRAGAAYRVRIARAGEHGSDLVIARPDGSELAFSTAQLGEAAVYAATAAVAAVERGLGVALHADQLNAAFASAVAGEAGRLSRVDLADGVLVLDDTYNANPESVESSLRAARALADARQTALWLVLGEMRELGALSLDLHQRVGAAAAAVRPELVIGLTGDARALCEAAEKAGARAQFVADVEAAAELLRAVRPRDVVLVKASRGVRAERVVQRLLEGRGKAA